MNKTKSPIKTPVMVSNDERHIWRGWDATNKMVYECFEDKKTAPLSHYIAKCINEHDALVGRVRELEAGIALIAAQDSITPGADIAQFARKLLTNKPRPVPLEG